MFSSHSPVVGRYKPWYARMCNKWCRFVTEEGFVLTRYHAYPHVVIRTRASSVSKHRMVIELPLYVFRLISGDESPTTNFPDIPGYHVCNTTETVMYMLFV